jgi:RNA polymerase sigma-70 factor (ECF subfamily)
MQAASVTTDGVTTDEALFTAYRDGREEGALAALVDRHWERCYRLALGVVRDPGAAEDVAQDAFVQVVNAARGRKTLDPFSGWLVSVVLNGARKSLRSSQRREKHELKARREEETTVETSSIREYVAALPESLGTPILLHYGLGLTQAEVARTIGCPEGTVASRLRTGLAKMRESLAASGVAAVGVEAALAEAWGPARGAPVPHAPAVKALVAKAALAPVAALPAVPAVVKALALVLGLGAAGAAGVGMGLFGSEVAPVPAAGTAALASASEPALPATTADAPREAAPSPAVADAVPAASPSRTAAASDALDPERDPGPYPWELPANPLLRLYGDRNLSLGFEDVSLSDVVTVLERLGLPPMRLDPRLGAAKDTSCSIAMRNLPAVDVVELLVAMNLSGAKVVPDGNDAVKVVRREDVPPTTDDGRIHADMLVSVGRPDDSWKQAFTAILGQPLTLDFQGTLQQAIDRLGEEHGAGTNLVLGLDDEIDGTKLAVAFHAAGQPIGTVLDGMLRGLGLRQELRGQSVFITRKPPAPSLAERRVTLELRGATVAELTAALEKQGITAVAGKWAWAHAAPSP